MSGIVPASGRSGDRAACFLIRPQWRRGNIGDALARITFNSSSLLSIGPATNAPQGRIVNTYQVQDNWSWFLGRHGLKAGVNTYAGKLTYEAVAIAQGLDYTPLDEMLGSTSVANA